MGFWKAKTSKRFNIIWKDVKSLGRGSVSLGIGAVAAAIQSGGDINWKAIGSTVLYAFLANVAQRVAGQSNYPPDEPTVQ